MTVRSKNQERINAELETNNKIAYGYIRVSTESQKDRKSLNTQQKSILDYCDNNDLELRDTFRDEGISGRSINGRDGFLELMRSVRPGNFVIVYELSRFSRDLDDLTTSIKNLIKIKCCTFICLNPFMDSRADGFNMNRGIFGAVAEQESERTSVRVKSNMARLSNEGKLLCRPPFGYVHDQYTRQYLPDHEQQEVLKELEILYLSDVKVNKIATILNDKGFGHVLNNNKKTKIDDPKFTASNIDIILRGYGIKKDNKSPKYTYRERVENWNASIHKSKIKRDELSSDEKILT